MTAGILRADALTLPLADNSVDVIITSPPYFQLRSYQDQGMHYSGQIGSEESPAAFLEALWRVTAECWRVLKPSGSLFVNLGDKYATAGGHKNGPSLLRVGRKSEALWSNVQQKNTTGVREKSLVGLPWRYAIGCIDGFADPDGRGWILRSEIVWEKPNGLPESVIDRVRRSHEQFFHFVKSHRYFSAIDEIREVYADDRQSTLGRTWEDRKADGEQSGNREPDRFTMTGHVGQLGTAHPLGKLPGSVWSIPSEPLNVPAHIGVDHFAAFPTEWPRRLILGWSPPAICCVCAEGRRPVVDKQLVGVWHDRSPQTTKYDAATYQHFNNRKIGSGGMMRTFGSSVAEIVGYVCSCTPYVDHAGEGQREERHTPDGGYRGKLTDLGTTGAWREWLLDDWTPPSSRPAVVLDVFGGTGTVAMVAKGLGRVGISVDLSADYCRLASWRVHHSGHDLKAIARTYGDHVAKSVANQRQRQQAGQSSLF